MKIPTGKVRKLCIVQLPEWVQAELAAVSRLATERDRMRSALEEIGEHCSGDDRILGAIGALGVLREKARAALAAPVTIRKLDEGEHEGCGIDSERAVAAVSAIPCENDLLWRLQHPLWVHGPGAEVQLEKDATAADIAAAAATISRLTEEREGLRKALTDLDAWLDQARAKIGAIDGYDYSSGEEFGLRCAQIQLQKLLATYADPDAQSRGGE